MSQPHLPYRPLAFREKVRIVAPSAPFDKTLFNAGITFLKLNKIHPVYDAAIFARKGYLAGGGEQRAAQLLAAFSDSEVKAVWTARGGYGALHILPFLEQHVDILKKSFKPFIGFSDATVLHSFFVERCEWATIHAPNITTIAETDRRSQNHLIRLLQGEKSALQISDRHIQTIQQGVTRGIVKGGNLTSLVSLLGTPWEPCFDDCILLIEEVNEVPYRVDRLVTQLRLAGKFAKVRGLIIGECSYREHHQPVEKQVDPYLIVEQSGVGKGIPVMAGFPVGHGARNMALILGARALMDAEARVLSYTGS